MHDYLRAVGFSCITEKTELDMLLHIVSSVPDHIYTVKSEDNGISYTEKCKDFAFNAGITVRGETDRNKVFSAEYYFPHYTGRLISLTEDVTAQKHAEREEYDGVCDIGRERMSVIFHMNRLEDSEQGRMEQEEDEGIISRFVKNASVRFSALSISGKVLLPLKRRSEQKKQKRYTDLASAEMMAEDMEGFSCFADAETQTIAQIDSYLTAVRRLKKEDLLSVVDTYFMPCGISYDQYSILGDIIDWSEEVNQLTGEVLVQMIVNCNGILLDICMNREDLLGQPAQGRRFLGNVWMQGVFDGS